MEYREFGRTGFKASKIGMGTYYDPLWILTAMLFRVHRGSERRIRALQLGIEEGINLIDTAEIYHSEPLVGRAIQGFRRDELLIASKVWPNHLHYDGVIQACGRSLRRLNTTYLDLYQIHWPSRSVPLRETMRAMERLVDEGKIRHIGVSNFSLKEMVAAEEALGRHELASTQMHYSLAHRNVERDILPHCESRGIAFLAYYPLAHGKLAGRRLKATQAYETISLKHGGRTPAQIALNWLCAKSRGVIPIPRASNSVHVKEDLGTVSWALDDEDLKLLERAFSP